MSRSKWELNLSPDTSLMPSKMSEDVAEPGFEHVVGPESI